MCLSTITKEFPKQGSGKAYKIFRLINDKIRFPFIEWQSQPQGTTTENTVNYNQWLTAENRTVNYGEIEYLSGFHLFANLEDAQQIAILLNAGDEEFRRRYPKYTTQIIICECDYDEKMYAGTQVMGYDSVARDVIVANKIKINPPCITL